MQKCDADVGRITPMGEWREFLKEKPETIGWYGTLSRWESIEEFFPGAHYWDGDRWNHKRAPIKFFSPMVFKSEDAALEWAYRHCD